MLQLLTNDSLPPKSIKAPLASKSWPGILARPRVRHAAEEYLRVESA